ncbi:uncharacterized protein L203_104934 [Cryptococcus depauperatus CBS 7841]|uniref:Uncharacterized protein n=1 Tax=Cryptococcus depauperatus CBS 7841 TaxID=1295531 RepID=A0AAJ8JWN7_9TREE
MLSERSHLLGAASKDNAELSLASQAEVLLAHHKSPSVLSYSTVKREIDLGVHLYALYLLQCLDHADGEYGIQYTLMRQEEGQMIRQHVSEDCESLLDWQIRDARTQEGEEDIASADYIADELLMKMLWNQWPIDAAGTHWASAIDLMLSPFSEEPSFCLSHPVVRHVLARTWLRGISEESDFESFSKWNKMERWITRFNMPVYSHALHLLSFLVLYGSTLTIAIAPMRWITPLPIKGEKEINAIEIVWLVWCASHFLHTVQYGATAGQHFLLFPSHLAFISSFFSPLRPYSFALLALSIPTLTIFLILPTPPSLPILLTRLMPYSIITKSMILKSIKIIILFSPLILSIFGLFVFSLKGDIFRGFSVLGESTFTNSVDNSSLVKPGVSPFCTRLSLFCTFVIVVMISVIVSVTNLPVPPRNEWNEYGKRWKGADKLVDDWEKEWGTGVGREARAAWANAVRKYVRGARQEMLIEGYGDLEKGEKVFLQLTTVPVFPPLNMLVLPAQIVRIFVKLTQKQKRY